MKNVAAVVTVALALLAAPSTRAQPVSARSGPDTYLEFDVGAFIPQAPDLSDFDPHIAFSGTFGAKFNPNVGVEASLGYYRAASTTAAVPPAPANERSLNVMPLLVNLRLVAPFKTMELSARAGVGIHFASLHSTGGNNGNYYDTSTAFGWQVGASAAFNLSPTMLVGVDVLGTFAQATFAGADVGIDGITVSVKLGYRL